MADSSDYAAVPDDDRHDGFAYQGDGVYACFCGKVLSTAGLVQTNTQGDTPGVYSLREQFQAHLAEVAKGRS